VDGSVEGSRGERENEILLCNMEWKRRKKLMELSEMILEK
jgi:hypothetical protein